MRDPSNACARADATPRLKIVGMSIPADTTNKPSFIIALRVSFIRYAPLTLQYCLTWHPQGVPLHFKYETISLCHPERSEGSLSGERSFAALRMTLLHRLRLTRNTSSLNCIAPCGITAGPDSTIWFTEISSNKIGRLA